MDFHFSLVTWLSFYTLNINLMILIPISISRFFHVLPYFRRKKKATFDTASKISEPRLGEQYRAIADYTKEDKWDLNLKAGTEVEVIEKTESGRYLIKEFMQVMKVTESDVCSGVLHN